MEQTTISQEPFGLRESDKLQIFFIEKFGKITEKPRTKEWKIEEKFGKVSVKNEHEFISIKCPYCKYIREKKIFKKPQDLEPIDMYNSVESHGNGVEYMKSLKYRGTMKRIINSGIMEKMVRGFIFHMESKIRLGGCKEHMELTSSIFGKDYTLELLKKWMIKGRMVIKNMDEYIENGK